MLHKEFNLKKSFNTLNINNISSICKESMASQTLDSLGQTDKMLYEKVSGQPKLSDNQFNIVESVLPCPHDPSSLELLYLEG